MSELNERHMSAFLERRFELSRAVVRENVSREDAQPKDAPDNQQLRSGAITPVDQN